jgi:hypothetical protein
MLTDIRRAVRWNPPRLLLALALVLAALASGYGISQVRASHTDPNEVHLCVSSYTGQVRHVQNPTQCTGGYVVTVNQQGLPGPQGSQGPVGPQGPQGPQGDLGPAGIGVSDFVLREADPVEIGAFDTGDSTASCLAGEVAVGGGYFVIPYYNVSVRVDTRSGSDSWYVELLNNVNDDIDLYVNVICAQP